MTPKEMLVGLGRGIRENRAAFVLVGLGEVCWVGALINGWWLFEIFEIPLFLVGIGLLITKRGKRPTAPAPCTHDWTRRNYTSYPSNGGLWLGLVFWSDDGPVPRTGDYLILRSKSTTTRYRIKDVEKAPSEGDVYAADAVFAPRTGRTP